MDKDLYKLVCVYCIHMDKNISWYVLYSIPMDKNISWYVCTVFTWTKYNLVCVYHIHMDKNISWYVCTVFKHN